MQNIKVKCKFCGKTIRVSSELGIWKHYNQKHYDILAPEEVAEMIYLIKKSNPLYNIPSHLLISYIKKCIKEHNRNYYEKQFESFYKMVTVVREMTLADIDRFFSHVLPWKLSHPRLGNSIELCSVIFENKEEADLLYQKYMLVKNPYYRHGSELSPFSTKHKRYQHLSDEQKEGAVSNFASNIKKGTPAENSPLHIEYYLKQGMNEEEAQSALRERQNTFSLEKCIEKYGEEEGKKRWQERQEKWLSSYKKVNFSMISQMLFWEIYETMKDNAKNIYFATLNENKEKDFSGKNYEYVLQTHESFVKPDFIILNKRKIIEFDGDYWHNKGRGNRLRDSERDVAIERQGFKVYHVAERDFKKNPQKIIQKCIEFIKS